MYNIHGPEMWFEWDESKARSNAKKHGVTFWDALSALVDPLAASLPDPYHSLRETRFITIGHSSDGRLLTVSYTERKGVTRIISARCATRRERKSYERN